MPKQPDDTYIRLWRKSLDCGLMQNPKLWTFWCWCLMRAQWQPAKVMIGYEMVTLQPGQFVFGRHKAAKFLKMSERAIRTCLDHLVKLENVTIKTTNRYSVITIVNWTVYQQEKNKNDQVNDQQATSRRPAGDHIQESKEGKEVKQREEKILYGDYVQMTETEYKRLCDDYGESVIKAHIQQADDWVISRGKQKDYKDHNRMIRNWLGRAGIKKLSERPKRKLL